jgi:hypothetical protein
MLKPLIKLLEDIGELKINYIEHLICHFMKIISGLELRMQH